MPFTVSHVAAVLPLRRLGGLTTLPLALGSMVPDLPMVVGLPVLYELTHSWPGALTADIALTVALAAVWVHWAGDAVLAALPGPVRDRLPARPAPLPLRFWRRPREAAWWVASAATGALTHVVLDVFTHEDRGRRVWAGLDDRVLRLTIADWLQYVLGVAGLVVLLLYAASWFRSRSPRRAEPAPRAAWLRRWPLVAWGVLAASCLGLAAARASMQALSYPRGLRFRYQYIGVAQHAAFGALAGVLVTLLVLGALWWWLNRPGRRARRPGRPGRLAAAGR